METQAMTVKKYRTDTPRSLIVSDPNQLAKKLTRMIVNGRNCNEMEASAWAEYALATGLDPFIGECYFIPGSGVGPGIQGWYRKAAEQLEYECQKTKYPVAAFWFEYEQLAGDTADFNSDKGDVGYRSILYDDVTKRDWEERILGASIKLMVEAKVDHKTSMEMAREIVGKCPHWEGIGVVHAEENFAAPGKPEKYDRHERAQKRGAKIALKKRFPRLYLPEPADWDPAYILNGHAVDVVEDEASHEQRSEATILGELGYAPDPEPAKPVTPKPTNGDGVYQAVVDAKLSENVISAKNALSRYCHTGYDTPEKAIAWFKLFRGWRDKGLEAPEAATRANQGEIPE